MHVIVTGTHTEQFVVQLKQYIILQNYNRHGKVTYVIDNEHSNAFYGPDRSFEFPHALFIALLYC